MGQKKELRGRGLSEFSKYLSEFRRPRSFFLTHHSYKLSITMINTVLFVKNSLLSLIHGGA